MELQQLRYFDEVARTVLRMSGAVASTDHSVEVVTSGRWRAPST